MSSPSSDGALRLRLTSLLQELASRNPSSRVSATGISQQLDADAERVSAMLVDWAREGLLEPIIIERCDDGHIATDTLDEDEESTEAYCHYCRAKTTITRYVIYGFAPALVSEAAKLRRPKVLRRAAPMMSTLGRVLVRFRRSPPRIQHHSS